LFGLTLLLLLLCWREDERFIITAAVITPAVAAAV
jgi:hypothetical protein